MAPRPHWKGYLKLSLVSCPIALYPAISAAERVSFRQVNRQTGNRLRHQLVDSVTGEQVESFDKGRGYEIGENRFLLVEDEELEAARSAPRIQRAPAAPMETARPESNMPPPAREAGRRAPAPAPQLREAPLPLPAPPPRRENTRTIEIEHFVPGLQIDPRYYDKPYYIVPRDQIGQEAFAVIRDAMRSKGMVGLGSVMLSARERPIAIEAMGNGIRGVTLRYRNEVRNEAEYFADIPEIKLPQEMIRVAEHIIETKAADFDPAMLEDHSQAALVGILKAKQAQLPMEISPVRPSPQNVTNLMDVLRRSLAAEKKPAALSKSPSTARRPARKKMAGGRS